MKKFQPMPSIVQKNCEIVYEPGGRPRSLGPRFSGDFECGNLGTVYLTAPRQYEIHMIPDPMASYSCFWYFFKVENLTPGDYTFSIVGFFRDAKLHRMGVQPTALSVNSMKNGIGWQRFGDDMNFWCSKKGPSPQWTLSFSFMVRETDTMYFSYIYPYTYSELRSWLSIQKDPVSFSFFCTSPGGVDIPVIFWDADIGKCVNLFSAQSTKRPTPRKPLIVMTARHHPGESIASYAMEAFMKTLFTPSKDSSRLLQNFSFMIIPMMNPDGVICGFFRPCLAGYDMNRSWISPGKRRNPVEYTLITVLDKLVKTRPLVFFLDYHGHSAQCNAFTYGVWNNKVPFNQYEGMFPRFMARNCSTFDEDSSCSLAPDEFWFYNESRFAS